VINKQFWLFLVGWFIFFQPYHCFLQRLSQTHLFFCELEGSNRKCAYSRIISLHCSAYNTTTMANFHRDYNNAFQSKWLVCDAVIVKLHLHLPKRLVSGAIFFNCDSVFTEDCKIISMYTGWQYLLQNLNAH